MTACHLYRPGSRLWLALRFSNLPLDVLGVNDTAGQAIVVTEKQRVVHANESAYAAGVRYGMDTTTAQLLANCVVHGRERKKEMQALDDVSAQLYRFTPYIETYSSETIPQMGLLLEISSCLALFSGVNALVAHIVNYLQSTIYSVEYGFAHTARGAWLLSFSPTVITGEETRQLFCERLRLLPIQLLHDFPSEVDALEKTGFHTLGDIACQIEARKISSIRKRFGSKFAQIICEIFAIGQTFQQPSLFDKPLVVYQPVDFFSHNIQFDYPISKCDQLYYPIEHLLQDLSHYLHQRQLQCQHIEWTFADIYKNTFLLHVHTDNAESQWELLYDLTLIQLDNRELPFAVDSLALVCRDTSPVQNRSQLLAFDQQRTTRSQIRGFALTIAKLKARLGDTAVFKLSYQDALLPESSNGIVAVNEICNQQLPDVHRKALRPGWLLPSPVRIEERRHGLYWRGYLTLLAGPERLRTTWWETPAARDYFVAQRHDHVRLWVFLDLHQKNWYVHGVFG